ncbi:hypothetical protein HS1genome_0732 [Sulfodiicoccus acidiphilus]|uniref:Uncharacterized protein n=2 Tax=Sulfodiicoccus acidiphilus TaxID=1670455 RepID=A0A348B2E1_9CREN|nr:hypothetical protein HS1genome_0732 [Sulfodiicoccus acidiphilus]GGT90149.1 hypothetical protein GCM10007116_04900 [Sulfodiicoccus acidiphilus]
MSNVAEAAVERGLEVVFILPYFEDAPRRRGFIPVRTGMEPRARSVLICASADVLVSLGGEAGTITEVFMAYGMGKPVVVLKGTGMSTDRLAEAFGERLDSRRSAVVKYVDTPEEAGLEAIRLGLTYRGGR